jgi:hypothetical protein
MVIRDWGLKDSGLGTRDSGREALGVEEISSDRKALAAES